MHGMHSYPLLVFPRLFPRRLLWPVLLVTERSYVGGPELLAF